MNPTIDNPHDATPSDDLYNIEDWIMANFLVGNPGETPRCLPVNLDSVSLLSRTATPSTSTQNLLTADPSLAPAKRLTLNDLKGKAPVVYKLVIESKDILIGTAFGSFLKGWIADTEESGEMAFESFGEVWKDYCALQDAKNLDQRKYPEDGFSKEDPSLIKLVSLLLINMDDMN
jgi:hypothetical protein